MRTNISSDHRHGFRHSLQTLLDFGPYLITAQCLGVSQDQGRAPIPVGVLALAANSINNRRLTKAAFEVDTPVGQVSS
jgi:hypothetical protein